MNQRIDIYFSKNIELSIKREDLLHPFISGNKFRKLKYNLKEAKRLGFKTLVTFGGAFSNHILATAAAGKEYGFDTIGIIRGNELENNYFKNPTLVKAEEFGMRFYFVDRESYRLKDKSDFFFNLKNELNDFYLVPEGGTNDLAIKGCEEILLEEDKQFDFVCCAVGTGGTITGLINSSSENQKIIGFPALKGDFLFNDIRKFAKKANWDLNLNYHFNGYGKVNSELIAFLNDFYNKTNIPLDPIYTGKTMFGVIELINKGYFPENSKILVIHTGGLQGVKGINNMLKKKNREFLIYEE